MVTGGRLGWRTGEGLDRHLVKYVRLVNLLILRLIMLTEKQSRLQIEERRLGLPKIGPADDRV